MALKHGQCRLCLNHKPLLRRSHIVPEFFYSNLYDDQHRFLKINKQSLETLRPVGKAPKGEYEGDILCEACDNGILGHGYEDYSRDVFYPVDHSLLAKNNHEKFRSNDGLDVKIVHDINYVKTKLMLLSILWRANISTRPLFNTIKLSRGHSELLRWMVHTGNPGAWEVYPVVFFRYTLSGKTSEMVGAPRIATIRSKSVAILPISQFILFIFLGFNEVDIPVWVREACIKENNTFPVVHLNEQLTIKFFKKYFD